MSLLSECAAVRPGINSRIPIWKSSLVIKILENLHMYQVLSHAKWRIEAKGIGEINNIVRRCARNTSDWGGRLAAILSLLTV